jgi:hypothetical protein
MSNIIKWFSGSEILNKAFISTENDLNLQPLGTDDDSGGSSDFNDIKIVAGTLLVDDSAV